MSEQQLNDLGQHFLRPQLVAVSGAVIPYPCGGKQRQVMINLVPRLMPAKGVSPIDVLNAITNQNLVLPSGKAESGYCLHHRRGQRHSRRARPRSPDSAARPEDKSRQLYSHASDIER